MLQRRRCALAAALGLALAACQSGAGAAETAAVLVRADAATMAKVKTVLAEAMGRASVELGAGDLTTSSTIVVLPRRPSSYEGASPATPTLFDIQLRGGRCYAVRRVTGEAYALTGVACRALD